MLHGIIFYDCYPYKYLFNFFYCTGIKPKINMKGAKQ